ncbi:MAG: 2-hydroxyglutaryl-CoA dehydratase [Clostridiaceae bacterium]|nr:2-hydroxyglutaryl-CoA dehydratase [Clostridiaceae bacterium]
MVKQKITGQNIITRGITKQNTVKQNVIKQGVIKIKQSIKKKNVIRRKEQIRSIGAGDGEILFTEDMKEDYTILAPGMLPIYFTLLKIIFGSYGYNIEILDNHGPRVIEQGLKYMHDDTCYPVMLVTGQMIDALDSGKYDIDKTALMVTRTGRGCRVSNFICLLRKALKKAGYGHVPVTSLDFAGFEKESSIKMSLPMIRKALISIIYSDTLMLLDNQVKPYEIVKGQSEKTVEFWTDEISEQFKQDKGYSLREFERNLKDIVDSFSLIPVSNTGEKIKVGIAGDIYVRYSSLGNNNLISFLHEENCEVMVPGLLGFILFILDNTPGNVLLHGGSMIKRVTASMLMKYFLRFEKKMIDIVSSNPRFVAPIPFKKILSLIDGIISPGCQVEMRWMLAAEIAGLIEKGYENIICVQPFGCLPSHMADKGMISRIKSIYKNANIVPIDYKPGVTEGNQENGVKQMLSVAKSREKSKTGM